MTIYYYKVYNNIGNAYIVGRRVGSKEEVEKYCKQQIQEAKVNSPGKWNYDIKLIEKVTRKQTKKAL